MKNISAAIWTTIIALSACTDRVQQAPEPKVEPPKQEYGQAQKPRQAERPPPVAVQTLKPEPVVMVPESKPEPEPEPRSVIVEEPRVVEYPTKQGSWRGAVAGLFTGRADRVSDLSGASNSESDDRARAIAVLDELVYLTKILYPQRVEEVRQFEEVRRLLNDGVPNDKLVRATLESGGELLNTLREGYEARTRIIEALRRVESLRSTGEPEVPYNDWAEQVHSRNLREARWAQEENETFNRLIRINPRAAADYKSRMGADRTRRQASGN